MNKKTNILPVPEQPGLFLINDSHVEAYSIDVTPLLELLYYHEASIWQDDLGRLPYILLEYNRRDVENGESLADLGEDFRILKEAFARMARSVKPVNRQANAQ